MIGPVYILENKETRVSPETSASIFSKYTYQWMNDLFKTGRSRIITSNDLYPVSDEFKAKNVTAEFQLKWTKELNNGTPTQSPGYRVFKTLWAAYKFDFIKSAFFLLLETIITVTSPMVLRLIIQWLQTPDSDRIKLWNPYLLTIALFSMQILAAIFSCKSGELSSKTGFKLRTGLSLIIYTKTFNLSSKVKQNYSTGKIVNISTNDTNRLDMVCQFVQQLWAAPILLLFATVLLYSYLGVSAFVGLAFIIGYIPFQVFLSNSLAVFRRKVNAFADVRMKAIHESLKGIRVIKMYAWENSFLKLISSLRMKEFTFVKYFVVSRATASSVTQTIPTFSMILTFMVYAQMGNEMRADIILPSLALFYSLRVPMLFIPIAISSVTDAWLALGRIGDLLLSEELSTVLSHDEKDQNNNVALHIDNGCFEWETTDDSTNTFKLSNINVSIPKGSLTAIVGTIGSGKSSFLNALVGDMNCKSGTVKLNGTISYCQQQAWIQNSTLRDNILFGNPYDEAKYQSVLNDCALARDLSILPAGDKTEIGENGINLSGGQKQRISIARAVYAETDIVLLDDPLSAVDSHVGRYLFEQCIQTKLAGTTRILVTHQLHFVSQVDSIILMDNGEMVAQGSYEELMESSKLFHDLMTKYSTEKDEEEVEDNAAVIKDPIAAEKSKNEIQVNDTAPNGKLMAKEDQAKGVVSTSVLKDYLMLAGGLKTAVLCLFLVGSTHLARIYTDQWLTYWLTYKFNLSQAEYINIYLLLGLAQMGFGCFYAINVVLSCAFASKSLHNNAILKVFRSPIAFFDSTPLGRITSRFSRDVDTLDTLLPDSIRTLFWTSSLCFTNMILIAFLIPWFTIPIVIVLICYYSLQQYYMSTSRELKRIDSVARSPLLAQVSETLGGLSTIRAYKAEDRFIERNTMLLDKNNQAIYLGFMIQRWIQLRLQCLNSVLLLVATILAILLRDTLNPGITGVIIAYTLQITAVFTWTFKQLADTENYMNSSERLTYYMRDLASEKPSIIDSARPAKSWPHEGLIEAENMVMRYTPSSPIILNDLSFKIEPGHKIGIVGRTGAGKSTIFTSILRLVELESGKLTIDGVDISKIGLEDLRSRIAVIPQEPVLFSGTIRSNLDPFTDYSDEQLWDVLERSNLSSAVKSNASGLESPVTEGGENWSTGQRQLICLARAMLKKSKIIMLDEATASVDFETDEYIQKAIRKDFSDATIVTIAHRLNTIADYDKVMVLSFGKLVEYDSPHVLLSNPTGEFSKMVAETGKANAELIRVAAKHIEMIYNKR